MRLGTYYRAQMLRHFKIEATGENVLDVGGYDGYWLSTQKAKIKYVLDPDIRKLYKNVHYIKASALKIPFKSNYFDQVFAFDVIEHVEKDKEQKFLDELIRVCKNDGDIILFIPSDQIKIFPPFSTNYVSKKWGHFKCSGYSKNQLEQFLSKYNNINYQIIEDNAFFYRLLYFPVRLCWYFFPKLIMRLVNLICDHDHQKRSGINGFYIIKIVKQK